MEDVDSMTSIELISATLATKWLGAPVLYQLTRSWTKKEQLRLHLRETSKRNQGSNRLRRKAPTFFIS